MNGCLSISASRVGSRASLSARRSGTPVTFSAKRSGLPAEIGAAVVGDPMRFASSRMGKALQFSAGLVCSVSTGLHLRVEPADVFWLTPENDFSQDVGVYANVSWTIE